MAEEVILKTEFLLNIDFSLLREQKLALVDACDLVPDNVRHAFEGILGILDDIQDQAIDKYGLSSEVVLGCPEEWRK
jgi:hypothetical protein